MFDVEDTVYQSGEHIASLQRVAGGSSVADGASSSVSRNGGEEGKAASSRSPSFSMTLAAAGGVCAAAITNERRTGAAPAAARETLTSPRPAPLLATTVPVEFTGAVVVPASLPFALLALAAALRERITLRAAASRDLCVSVDVRYRRELSALDRNTSCIFSLSRTRRSSARANRRVSRGPIRLAAQADSHVADLSHLQCLASHKVPPARTAQSLAGTF